MFPLLPADHASSLEDEVLQLDLSARLAVTWAAAGGVSVLVLAASPIGMAHDPTWAFTCLALLALSWLSYRGAVESALAHGRDIEVTVDLYKGLLIDALGSLSRKLSATSSGCWPSPQPCSRPTRLPRYPISATARELDRLLPKRVFCITGGTG